MTWKTSRGERVLRGAEAKLVAKAISTIVDFHRGEEGLCFGRKIIRAKFEELTEAEQFTVLEDIAIGLLAETSAELCAAAHSPKRGSHLLHLSLASGDV